MMEIHSADFRCGRVSTRVRLDPDLLLRSLRAYIQAAILAKMPGWTNYAASGKKLLNVELRLGLPRKTRLNSRELRSAFTKIWKREKRHPHISHCGDWAQRIVSKAGISLFPKQENASFRACKKSTVAGMAKLVVAPAPGAD
jgi:hypothetical protein